MVEEELMIPKDEKLSEDEFEVFEVIDTDEENENLFNDLDDDYMLPVNPEIIKCAFCDDRFTDAQTLQDHLQTHIHNAPKIYRCAICQMDFSDKKSVGIHMQDHIKTKNDSRKPNKCKRCLQRFESLSQLQAHNNKVHKKIYVCPICDKVFDAREQAIPHIKTHVDSNIFTCPLPTCRLVLNNTDELRDHIVAHNSKTQSKQVFEDKPGTSFNSNKTEVIVIDDESSKILKCHFCDENDFTNETELRKHTLTHVNEKNLKCHICRKTFETFIQLNKHIETHGENNQRNYSKPRIETLEESKRFLCSICMAPFTSTALLIKHAATSHREESKSTGVRACDAYACPDCNVTYVSLKEFLLHLKTHLNENVTYKCVLCDVLFQSEELLESHVKTSHSVS